MITFAPTAARPVAAAVEASPKAGTNMRAAFCTAPGQFGLRELPRPQPLPGQVLVRVRSCGICGSDLDWYRGHFPPPKICPGHEIAGEVAEIAGSEHRPGIGDRVVVEPLLVCGHCPACRIGDYQLCPQVEVLGVSRDGGFAEYVCVPRDRVYPLPAELEFAAGSLAEPAAVAVHGVRLGKVGLGDRVVVLGAGTIGLLAIVAARRAGAAQIAITARYAHQARMARRLGAAQVFRLSGEDGREWTEFVRRHPPDVVLETVGGSGESLNDAIRIVRPGGTVVVLGVFPEPPRCDALALLVKEVRVVGSITYGRGDRRTDFELGLQMLTSNPTITELVTHRFALERIRDAFELARDKRRGAIKVVVTQ